MKHIPVILRSIYFFVIVPILSFLVSPINANAQAGSGEPLSPRNANYTMVVNLDTENRLINGTEILTWRNITQFPTSELQFHLYYNAWSGENTSFFQSIRYLDSFEFSEYRDNDWAYCKIRSMKIIGDHGFQESEVVGDLELFSPDDGNVDDRTVLRLPLARPVGPGETISLEIVWESKIPRPFARTGARGDYFFLAQWFPKIGVFEADGTWNCHQFIQTEFYADFGVYDVQLTIPSGWTIGATGREIETIDNNNGTTSHRFHQEDVHDFTWVTSPYLSVHTDRFEEDGLPPVDLRLLLMPDHADKVERYFESTKAGLKYYGQWFGAYPYGHVTIVDPAYQSSSGGMEYPTFFTGGTRWLSPFETRSPESVTIHEYGHQIWYGIVANNEFEHAWIDEGFNSYTQARTMKEIYPPRPLTSRIFEGFIPIIYAGTELPERFDGADANAGFYSPLKLDPMSKHSWMTGPGSYGLNSYNRPSMMLRTLENYLGWDSFRTIVSTFFDRWKFKHPKPEDFFAIVNEFSDENMNWFFDDAFYSADVYDYGVGKVTSSSFQESADESEENILYNPDSIPSKSTDENVSEQYHSRVFIRRWGEAVFPVDILVEFENGDSVSEYWNGKERWVRFDYENPEPVSKVIIDPERKLILDINSVNNSWVKESNAGIASTKWASQWMLWLQNFIEFFSYFS